jgi:hypothetical protein
MTDCTHPWIKASPPPGMVFMGEAKVYCPDCGRTVIYDLSTGQKRAEGEPLARDVLAHINAILGR